MRNLAIIPARGGSKRIPGKNIIDFLGKPIISYPIEVALQSGLFEKVIVSTDDEEIASISTRSGALVPFKRSSKTSGDFATINDVFLEVRQWFFEQGSEFDNYCMILPTTPLLNTDNLKKGYQMLISTSFDSVRPVVRFSYPVQRAFRLEDGKVSFMNPEHAVTRSQDLEPGFHDAGLFYFIKRGFDLSGDNKGAFEIDPFYAQDIDTPDDLKMAEMKYTYLFGKL